MKVLILGANGMLGHVLFRYLSEHYVVCGTVRKQTKAFQRYMSFCPGTIYPNIDANINALEPVIDKVKPDVIINCIGIIKQRKSLSPEMVQINTKFPYKLFHMADTKQIRFIHISTDCVFSGRIGNYNEKDIPTPTDFYGRSKVLGEPICDLNRCITIRTSMIGHELDSKYGLLEWFLDQDKCKGFKNAIFSGPTTLELSKIIHKIIENTDLSGLYHVAGKPISKFDLLNIIKNVYGLAVEIIPDESIKIDRSLDASNFNRAIGYTPPSWEDMITEMKDYEKA